MSPDFPKKTEELVVATVPATDFCPLVEKARLTSGVTKCPDALVGFDPDVLYVVQAFAALRQMNWMGACTTRGYLDNRIGFVLADTVVLSPGSRLLNGAGVSEGWGSLFGAMVGSECIATGMQITSSPSVSIIRYWKRGTMEAIPRTSGLSRTVTWSVTTGLERTHAEEFTQTWGGEAGLGVKGFEGKIHAEFSKTVTDIETWTYTETNTVSKTETLPPIDYADRYWVVWVPVEEYRFVDALGVMFTDDNWVFDQESLGVMNYPDLSYKDVYFYE